VEEKIERLSEEELQQYFKEAESSPADQFKTRMGYILDRKPTPEEMTIFKELLPKIMQTEPEYYEELLLRLSIAQGLPEGVKV